MRPAKLKDVGTPGILLQVGKYGAPFLVAGNKSDPVAVFLDGKYKFRSFKQLASENWDGLAIENVEFELDLESAIDLSGYNRIPGTIIRHGEQLSIAAIGDDAFGRMIEIPLVEGLPSGAPEQRVAFFSWRAFVTVGEEWRTVWDCKIPVQREW